MEEIMTLSLAHNCQFDEKENGVAFEVQIGDRLVRCFITSQVLEQDFSPCANASAKLRVVNATTTQNGRITQKVRERVAAGDPERITLLPWMFK
jgi:hypothetical protein